MRTPALKDHVLVIKGPLKCSEGTVELITKAGTYIVMITQEQLAELTSTQLKILNYDYAKEEAEEEDYY